MALWRLRHPQYDSDHDHIWVNGVLEHPFALPGVTCETCGETWAGTGVVSLSCPKSLRSASELRDRSPISAAAHHELRQRIESAAAAEGNQCPQLRPGLALQPCFLTVPTAPTADFLWAGPGSVLVSERIASVFAELGPGAVELIPVAGGRAGKANAKHPLPAPTTGEAEDLWPEAELDYELPSYFELIVTAESGPPHGVTFRDPCPACGRVTYTGNRDLRVHEDMWRGKDVFVLATTLWILLTEEFKAKLESIGPSNVVFERVGEQRAV